MALRVYIGANTGEFDKAMKRLKSDLNSTFGGSAMKASQNLMKKMKYVGAGLLAVGAAAVKMSADMAVTKRAFETLTGSAEKAQAHLNELEQFALKTPFEFSGLTEASRKLQAYGFEAEAVVPILTSLGDAAMAVGLEQEGIDRIALAMGQMNSQGKVTTKAMRSLAETGLPVWQMLADKIGVSVPQAMKMVTDGAISSRDGIVALLTGMNDKFGGMMDKVGGEIPQSFANMQDAVGTTMRALGDSLVETFDLKKKMRGAADWMGDFAEMAKNSGIKQAFEQMIPESVKTTMVAIGGVIMGVLVPAFAMWAVSVVAATWPLLAIGAACGTIAMLIYKNWESVGPFFKGLWEGIVSVFKSAYQLIAGIINKIIAAWNWMKERLGIETGQTIETEIKVDTKKAEKDTESLNEKIQRMIKDTSGGYDKDADKRAKAAEGARKKQEQEWAKLVKKAEETSSRIEDEWIKLTKTELDALEKWYAEEIKTLNESAAANANYQRDMQRLEEVYSEKRRRIFRDEAKERLDTFKQISDGYMSMQRKMLLGNASGSAADLLGMSFDLSDELRGVTDYFDNIAADYANGTAKQKQNILDTLNSLGVEYKKTVSDTLDFEASKMQAQDEIKRQYYDKEIEYYAQCKDIQSDIDAAYNKNSLAMLQETLTAEQAMRLGHMEAVRTEMDNYLQAMKDAYAPIEVMFANMQKTFMEGFGSAISDVIMGVSSLTDAFRDLGKSMIKVIVDYYAKQLASRLMLSIMGKQALAEETLASVAAGKAVGAAWAAAAANVSLASFGANAAPAMAGISATHALTSALSIPALATGGETLGPTIAMIGEGRYKEAVLPLSDRTFDRLADGINKAGGQAGATVNVYGDINSASDEERIFAGLFKNTRFALMGA